MASRDSSSPRGFSTLGLSDALVAAAAALGYEEPTPVQRAAIPILLDGRDLLGQAATGTGKTAAFALPMIQRLAAALDPKERKRTPGPAGMVLVPTRELAMQVSEAIHKYAGSTRLTVVPLYGGASMSMQIRAIERGAHIVVATPGRALDHIRRGTLPLQAVQVLVLDEADEMLDMGFAEDLDAIIGGLPETRQTALFSATLPSRILKIAARHLREPERVMIAAETTAKGKLPRIRQVAYVVRRDQKTAALDRILDMEGPETAIVFCRTRIEVDTLVETLNAHGYRAEALHGGMQQRQRDSVMQRVRGNKTDLLVATDVAARGLDIEHISHVINFNVPVDPESYVHRIGRTGRAGRAGTAITLAEPREHRLLRTIEQVTKQRIEVATVPTVADLRARQLEQTAAALRERLAANDYDDVRVLVTTLAGEFDIMDVAAAAVKMAHAAAGHDSTPEEIAAPAPDRFARGERAGREDRAPRGERPGGRGGDAPGTRIFFGAGRKAGIRPADLVGMITGEAGVPARAVGAIQITENFSVVEVPEELADEIIAATRAGMLRGKKVPVRRDRDSRG